MVETVGDEPDTRAKNQEPEAQESLGVAIREIVSEALESALADYRDETETGGTGDDQPEDDDEQSVQRAEPDIAHQEAPAQERSDSSAQRQDDNAVEAADTGSHTQGRQGGASGSDAEQSGTDARHADLLSQLPEPLSGVAMEVWQSEGQEMAETLVTTAVNALFSSRMQSFVRRSADDALQTVLSHALSPIDDPQQRHELYWNALETLRPIVRESITASFQERDRRIVQRHAKAAIPHLVDGEMNEVAAELGQALRDVTPGAEQVVSNNRSELVQLMQSVSTAFLQEGAESVQDEVEEQAEEVQQQLAEALKEVQERLEDARRQLREGLEEGGSPSSRWGRGFPPSGNHPSGRPPFGQPPSGMPPTGRPPSGRPPSGQHPALATSQRRR